MMSTKNAKPKPKVTPEFESLADAAIRKGYSVWTYRDLVASGELPAYRLSDKPGAGVRVKCSDVDALMRPMIPAAVRAEQADQ